MPFKFNVDHSVFVDHQTDRWKMPARRSVDRSIGCHLRAYLVDEKRNTPHKSTSSVLLVMLSPFNIKYAIYYHYYYCGCCCCCCSLHEETNEKKNTNKNKTPHFPFHCVYSKNCVYKTKDNRNETERERAKRQKKKSSSEKVQAIHRAESADEMDEEKNHTHENELRRRRNNSKRRRTADYDAILISFYIKKSTWAFALFFFLLGCSLLSFFRFVFISF